MDELGLLTVTITDLIAIIPLALLPASIVIGLVKPDLFDIDQAMRRTMVFAPLWIAIAGAYIGTAAALGFAASSLGLQVAVLVTILATVLLRPSVAGSRRARPRGPMARRSAGRRWCGCSARPWNTRAIPSS